MFLTTGTVLEWNIISNFLSLHEFFQSSRYVGVYKSLVIVLFDSIAERPRDLKYPATLDVEQLVNVQKQLNKVTNWDHLKAVIAASDNCAKFDQISVCFLQCHKLYFIFDVTSVKAEFYVVSHMSAT